MNEKKKTLIQLVSFGIVCFLLGVAFVYAQVSQTHVISGGVYPGAPSYTVWTDGAGNYYAKNSYGVLSVQDTNITVVFDTIINDNPSNLTIHVLPGTYWFTAGFTVDMRGDETNFKLICDPGTIFTSTVEVVGEVWDAYIQIYDGDYVEISGLTIDANLQDQTVGIIWGGYNKTNNVIIRNCKFFDFIHSTIDYYGWPIYCYNGDNWIVEGCYFQNCEHGVVLNNPTGTSSTNIVITNNVFVACGHSVNFEPAGSGEFHNVVVSNNVFSGNNTIYSRPLGAEEWAQCYINLYGAGYSSGVSVTGNTIIGEVGENSTAIRVNEVAECSITGNSIKNSNHNHTGGILWISGIDVRGSQFVTVSGNSIINCSIGIGTVQLTADTDYISVTGNTIQNATEYGIYFYRTSYSTYTGNVVYNAGKWGIYDGYGGQSYNCTIVSNVAQGTTGGIYVYSTTFTPVNLCWNGTTWIP